MGKDIHSSIMCNSPKLETIQMLSSREMDKLLHIHKMEYCTTILYYRHTQWHDKSQNIMLRKRM